MTRYFFDIHDGSLSRDNQGRECENAGEARRVAISKLLRKLSDDSFWDGGIWTLAIRDEDDTSIATIVFNAQG